MSHKQDEWRTPRALFEALAAAFGQFDLDAACDADNALVPMPSGWDGLDRPWVGRVFCNPPYSDIATWIDKAVSEHLRGECTVVMLLPARTANAWIDYAIQSGARVLFLRRRVQFEHPELPGKSSPVENNMLLLFGAMVFDRQVLSGLVSGGDAAIRAVTVDMD